jgi:hypothetical protein
VRARGTQARNARLGVGRPLGEPPRQDRFWQTVAIVAIIAAAVGWTTVAAMALGRPGDTATISGSVEPDEEDFVDEESFEPEIVEQHDAPDLEAMLPSTWEDTALVAQSSRGEAVLDDSDEWSQVLAGFIETQGRTSADFAMAQAYDDAGALDLVISAFRTDGIEGATLVDGLTAAWAADGEGFETTEVELGGKTVIKGLYAGDDLASYFYPSGDVVFGIETVDEELATAVLDALP